LVRKAEGKRPLGRPKHTQEDVIRMDLRERGWEGVDWLCIADSRDQWLALVKTVINFLVPLTARNFFTSCITVSFSRRTLLHAVSWLVS
jgi:hypothetical protein